MYLIKRGFEGEALGKNFENFLYEYFWIIFAEILVFHVKLVFVFEGFSANFRPVRPAGLKRPARPGLCTSLLNRCQNHSKEPLLLLT